MAVVLCCFSYQKMQKIVIKSLQIRGVVIIKFVRGNGIRPSTIPTRALEEIHMHTPSLHKTKCSFSLSSRKLVVLDLVLCSFCFNHKKGMKYHAAVYELYAALGKERLEVYLFL